MKAIFTGVIAIIASLAVAPAEAGKWFRDRAMGAVVVGAMANGTEYTAGRHDARDVNPRNRRLDHDRYEDDARDGHRNAGR